MVIGLRQMRTGNRVSDRLYNHPKPSPLTLSFCFPNCALFTVKGAKDVPKEVDENTLGIGRGITGLPFPAGTIAMAKLYPPILIAPSVRVTSPWGPAEGST